MGAGPLPWHRGAPQVIHVETGVAAVSEPAGVLGLLTLCWALHNAPVTAVSGWSLYSALAVLGGLALRGDAVGWQQVLGMAFAAIGVSLILSAR
jgi:drug/metabolite transporter (DMT)-like permease